MSIMAGDWNSQRYARVVTRCMKAVKIKSPGPT